MNEHVATQNQEESLQPIDIHFGICRVCHDADLLNGDNRCLKCFMDEPYE